MQIINIVLAAMVLVVTTILTFTAIEAENKKSTNSSITAKELNHKTSTNCNSAEILLMPKPNGGFIPVLIPSDHNCKENQND